VMVLLSSVNFQVYALLFLTFVRVFAYLAALFVAWAVLCGRIVLLSAVIMHWCVCTSESESHSVKVHHSDAVPREQVRVRP
jgi:hypothetical protein